jgi:hypothetical protein
LPTVIAARPSVLVVGCGASALMRVSEETRQVLQQHNIQTEALDTRKAVERFNELSQKGVNVAAALHLTCLSALCGRAISRIFFRALSLRRSWGQIGPA